MPTEIEEKKRAPKTYEVTLKKTAWINGECIGNQGAELKVEKHIYDALKASKVI